MLIGLCTCCAPSFFGGAVASPPEVTSVSAARQLVVGNGVVDDLAAASRILAAKGVVDAFGHVSIRHPDRHDRFLMSRSLAPALVTAADIMEHDLSGSPCEESDRLPFLERFIHGEIYRARPDVMSVVHSHSPSVVPFGLVQIPMRAMYHNAGFLAGGVPVFDIADAFGATDMLISSSEKAIALAGSLGDKPVALMRGHGSVAVGPSLKVAVFRAVMTEVNARLQVQALALAAGGSIGALTPEEGRLADAVNLRVVDRPWELWKRELINDS